MKKTLLIGMAVGLVALASSAFAANVGGAGIVGTSHDMGDNTTAGAGGTFVGNNAGNQDPQGRICVFCHHPHNALKPGQVTGYSPLWNRQTATAAIPGYNNGNMMGNASTPQHTLNATGTKVASVSLLCMSCHDGVTALNAYSHNTSNGTTSGSDEGGATATGLNLSGYTSGFSATDMSNHHPMGFVWADVEKADKEIAVSTTTFAGTTVAIADVLVDGKMECVTCHDVHNTANQSGAERFLWTSDDKSAFCLTCHLKASTKRP
jgi:predicted CXXCH cytochrome family protein